MILGINRIASYNLDEYNEELSKFAYVGGDAYNYIINSNILTGLWVIGASFFIVGTLFIITGSIMKVIDTKPKKDKLKYQKLPRDYDYSQHLDN